MQKIVDMEGYREKGELVISYETVRDVRETLMRYKMIQSQYQQYYDQLVKLNQNYKQEVHTARMYVSHFLQVLNLAIERGELKPEIRPDYGLQIDSDKLPRLRTEADIIRQGSIVIKTEEERIRRGGVPIYNPNIAKVKVHFSIFADHYYNMTTLRQNIQKFKAEINEKRPLVDELILDIWNQVETFYERYPIDSKLRHCRQFGLIYYTSNKELDRIRRQQESTNNQQLLDFGE